MTTTTKDGISVRVFEKNKVVLEKEIGSGSFGKVFKGKCMYFDKWNSESR